MPVATLDWRSAQRISGTPMTIANAQYTIRFYESLRYAQLHSRHTGRGVLPGGLQRGRELQVERGGRSASRVVERRRNDVLRSGSRRRGPPGVESGARLGTGRLVDRRLRRRAPVGELGAIGVGGAAAAPGSEQQLVDCETRHSSKLLMRKCLVARTRLLTCFHLQNTV